MLGKNYKGNNKNFFLVIWNHNRLQFHFAGETQKEEKKGEERGGGGGGELKGAKIEKEKTKRKKKKSYLDNKGERNL